MHVYTHVVALVHLPLTGTRSALAAPQLTLALKKAQRQAAVDAATKPAPPQRCALRRPLPFNISLGPYRVANDQSGKACATLELDRRNEQATPALKKTWCVHTSQTTHGMPSFCSLLFR